ncbi:MAG: hypothetical protein LBK55_11430 [Azoarcus sp.]|jgi:hypothetical protein|nr:hypothetical protein [Azoarcus sp.]
MMKKFLAILATVFLGACSDGVPHVEDPHHPVGADGNPIKATEFLTRYCQGKLANETCDKVRIASRMDSSRGPLPKGW